MVTALRQNHDPRAFLETLEGFAKRAHSAQLNSFEVTPAFAAAVIIAHLAGTAELVTINVLAVLFITSRLLYIALTAMNRHTWKGSVGLLRLALQHRAVAAVHPPITDFICYLADWAILRSLVWFAGMALIASFFFVSM